MTSTTDMTGHPDVTEISDLIEGLLSPSRGVDIRRHLDVCELCADVHASLEEIRSLLGTFPGPARMPDDVAQRIDAALAAEALLSAECPVDAEPPVPVSRETPPPSRPARHAPTAGTGPGRKGRKRRDRRKAAVLGAVLSAAVLGLGSVLVSTLMGGGDGDTTAQATRSAAADTFSATTLEQQVDGLLSPLKASKAPKTLGVEGGNEPPTVLRQPTVPSCVQRAIGKEDAALVTKEGVYQGRDVLLVVLPQGSDSTRVTAYLVDSRCVEQPSAQAKVLLQDTYTRP